MLIFENVLFQDLNFNSACKVRDERLMSIYFFFNFLYLKNTKNSFFA